MRLHRDWKWILRRAWSMRLMALAAALTGLEAVAPMFEDVIPRSVFAPLTFWVIALAMIMRVAAQKDTL